MADTNKEFLQNLESAREYARKQGEGVGPIYSELGTPMIWNTQLFDRGIEPTGTVTCENALAVGTTGNALDVVIVASQGNTENVEFPAGSSMTITLLTSESQNGTYNEDGPIVTIKAPAEGISAMPGELLARFAIGNTKNPYAKVKVEFTGTITGGLVDCALAYMAR